MLLTVGVVSIEAQMIEYCINETFQGMSLLDVMAEKLKKLSEGDAASQTIKQ